RQVGARLVRPHAEPEKTEAKALADGFALVEMARRFGTGLVQILERCARQLELAGGLEADVAVLALERNDIAVFEHRFPAIFGEAEEQIANAAALVPRRRVVIGAAIDEFLVFG